MASEKGFIQFFVGLILILVVVVGLFTWVYFKPNYSFKKLQSTPTPAPSIEAPKITIDQLFSNFTDKPIGQIPISISGKMIYRRVEELFISDLDGSHEMKIADVPAGLGGYAGHSADGTKIYYATYDLTTQQVYEMDLATNKAKKVFSLKADKDKLKNIGGNYLWDNVRVSPDGKYFASGGEDGIYLTTLSTGQSKKILSNQDKPGNNCNQFGFGCYLFAIPVWSADSQRLAVTKSVYENSHTVIVNPFTSQIVVDDLTGGLASWSKQGRVLAITEHPYAQGDVFLIDEGNGDKTGHLLSEKLLDLANNYAFDGSWSDNNSFAFRMGYPQQQMGYAIYNSDKNTYQSVPVSSSNPEGYILKMLPSGAGVLLLGEKSGLWLLATDQKTKTHLPIKMDELVDVFN